MRVKTMQRALTSLGLLAAVSIPASAQITTTTITREPIARTTFSRVAMLSPVSPATARRGQQSVTVQLTGLGTHFSQGVTTLSMGTGITLVSPVTVVSPTSATAVVNIDPSTPAGSRTVSVTSGAEVVSLSDAFSVTENPDFFPKSCGMASNYSLGSIFTGSSKQVVGLIDVAGTEDWFSVTVPQTTNLKLTLTGGGTGSEFEMSAQSSCGSPVLVTTSPGVAPKEFMLNGGASYVIRVRASQWKADNSRFTLTLVGQ
jgi:hypothetical protein